LRTPLRILCIIETIGRGGGAEQLLGSLLPALAKAGIQVEVAALMDWPDDLANELSARGIIVHRLGIRGPRAIGSGSWRVARLALRGRYDIFWGHLLLGNFYARLARLFTRKSKLVVTLHSKDFRETPGQGRPSRGRILERRLLAKADRKVAVSRALRADYEREFGWNDVEVIHNGIDVERIRDLARGADRNARRAALGVGKSDLLLVTPSRFVQVKGHRYLLEAAHDLIAQGIPLKLVLCGEGPLEADLRRRTEQLAIIENVRFAGLLAHEDLIPLIASADLLVMPSLYESFGLVPAESLAAGTPAIVTKVDGFLETVGMSKNVAFVEPASADALASAIAAFTKGNGPSVSFPDRVAEEFDIGVCASKWAKLFEGLN
jgi:glycosyltransferase involved in cell wall biosynthesis